MRVYLDASALTALVLNEPAAVDLVDWREANNLAEMLISDFCRGELASALAKSVRMKLEPGAVSKGLAAVDSDQRWLRLAIQPADIELATDFVARAEHSLFLPDAIHIAVARRTEAALLTLDLRQHVAAETLGVRVAGPLIGKPL